MLLGGDERDRTAGLCVANASLSHLSYTPTVEIFIKLYEFPLFFNINFRL
jgi:hypothetical protein